MAKISIDKDRMYALSNALRHLLESTEQFDNERESLDDDYFSKLAKINNRADKFQDEWAAQMDRDFPNWRTLILDEPDNANS